MQWFKIPEKIYFEAGSISYLEKMPNVERVFIVTDPGMVQLGYVENGRYYFRTNGYAEMITCSTQEECVNTTIGLNILSIVPFIGKVAIWFDVFFNKTPFPKKTGYYNVPQVDVSPLGILSLMPTGNYSGVPTPLTVTLTNYGTNTVGAQTGGVPGTGTPDSLIISWALDGVHMQDTLYSGLLGQGEIDTITIL